MQNIFSTGSRRNQPVLIAFFVVFVVFFAFTAFVCRSVLAWSNPTQVPPAGAPGPLSIVIGGTGGSTTAQALANLGAAASGANSDITSLTPLTGNPLQIGNTGLMVGSSLFGTDQGGNIELGGDNSTANPVSGGIPYIDFHYGTGTAQDYNVRIINNANNSLGIYANGSLTLNVGSTSTDSMIIGGGLGTIKVGTITFSDGTSQTTAATGIPSGLDILSASQTAPSGYTYTGNYVVSGGIGSWTTEAPVPALSGYPGIWASYGAAVNGVFYYFIQHDYTYLSGGQVHVAFEDTIDTYNSNTNSWSVIASGSGITVEPCAAQGNIIYFPAGATSYNTVTNTWAPIASNPYSDSALIWPDYTIVNDNGIIYLISGEYPSGSYYSTVVAYNTNTNSWSEPASIPTARADASASVVNGIIFVIGGYVGSTAYTTNEAYNPATNSWVEEAPMPTARYNLTSQAVNNIIYAIGGSTFVPSGSSYVSKTIYANEAYNPTTNSWSEESSINSQYDGSLLLSMNYNNNIYVIASGIQTAYSFTTPMPYYVMSKN